MASERTPASMRLAHGAAGSRWKRVRDRAPQPNRPPADATNALPEIADHRIAQAHILSGPTVIAEVRVEGRTGNADECSRPGSSYRHRHPPAPRRRQPETTAEASAKQDQGPGRAPQPNRPRGGGTEALPDVGERRTARPCYRHRHPPPPRSRRQVAVPPPARNADSINRIGHWRTAAWGHALASLSEVGRSATCIAQPVRRRQRYGIRRANACRGKWVRRGWVRRIRTRPSGAGSSAARLGAR